MRTDRQDARRRPQRRQGPPAPGWAGLLVGWLLVAVPLERRGPPTADPAALPPLEPLEGPAVASERALRRLPGVGETRAAAIAERRRTAGEELTWESVPGIGALTAGRIRAWFRRHGLPEELGRLPPEPFEPGEPWTDQLRFPELP